MEGRNLIVSQPKRLDFNFKHDSEINLIYESKLTKWVIYTAKKSIYLIPSCSESNEFSSRVYKRYKLTTSSKEEYYIIKNSK